MATLTKPQQVTEACHLATISLSVRLLLLVLKYQQFKVQLTRTTLPIIAYTKASADISMENKYKDCQHMYKKVPGNVSLCSCKQLHIEDVYCNKFPCGRVCGSTRVRGATLLCAAIRRVPAAHTWCYACTHTFVYHTRCQGTSEIEIMRVVGC